MSPGGILKDTEPAPSLEVKMTYRILGDVKKLSGIQEDLRKSRSHLEFKKSSGCPEVIWKSRLPQYVPPPSEIVKYSASPTKCVTEFSHSAL